jgi:hypothetical protein
MVNSIARLASGAENCTLSDWEKFCCTDKDRQLSMMQSLRDPLRRCSFRAESIAAVYGFSTDDRGVSLVTQS